MSSALEDYMKTMGLINYDLTTPYAQIGKTGPTYSVSSPYTSSSNYLLNLDTVSGLPQPKTRLSSDYLGFGSQIAPDFQPIIDQESLIKKDKENLIEKKDIPIIPKFTKIGDRLAARGGFGDQPGELKTISELATMTQEEIDKYTAERKQAQKAGLAESLIRIGEAFQGMPASANAMKRMQERQAAELYGKQVEAYEAAYASANPDQKQLLSLVGPTGYAGLKLEEAKNKLKGEAFAGQGMSNQFLNVLLQGQKNPSIRSTPLYATAYSYLSQPETETYINELGKQVTVTRPGIINPNDYLPPVGFATDAIKTDQPTIKGVEEEKVQEITPIERKELLGDIKTIDRVVNVLNDLEDAINRIQPGPLTIGTERAEIDSKYNSVLLELKNYAELGVLAGPDLDLLENWIGNPTSLKQLIKGGDEGTLQQLNDLRATALRIKNEGLEKLGEPTKKIGTPRKAIYNNKEIIEDLENNRWIYVDSGKPVE